MSLTIVTADTAKETGVNFILVINVASVDLQHTIFGWQFIQLKGKVSSIVLQRNDSGPFCLLRLDKPFAKVLVEVAGNPAATILFDYTKHINKTYTIVSDQYTHNDLNLALLREDGSGIKCM